MTSTTQTLATSVVFDTADATAAAAFWAAVVEGSVGDGASAEYATVERPGAPDFVFNLVPEGKVAKNRVHVDLSVPDLDKAEKAATELGATVEAQHDGWTTMQDPEGNEFCFVAASVRRTDPVTASSRAHSKDLPVMAPVPVFTAPRRIPPDLVSAVNQLEEYFAGHRRAFSVPVALYGPEFHQAAWRALARIPYGSTCSYSAQAAMVGNPGAARAVGAANHRNPLAIVLPCHRVIAADESLGGFGAGIARKQWLLAHERDTVAADPRATFPAEMSEALQ